MAAVGTVAVVVLALVPALWEEFLRRRGAKNRAYVLAAYPPPKLESLRGRLSAI